MPGRAVHEAVECLLVQHGSEVAAVLREIAERSAANEPNGIREAFKLVMMARHLDRRWKEWNAGRQRLVDMEASLSEWTDDLSRASAAASAVLGQVSELDETIQTSRHLGRNPWQPISRVSELIAQVGPEVPWDKNEALMTNVNEALARLLGHRADEYRQVIIFRGHALGMSLKPQCVERFIELMEAIADGSLMAPYGRAHDELKQRFKAIDRFIDLRDTSNADLGVIAVEATWHLGDSAEFAENVLSQLEAGLLRPASR